MFWHHIAYAATACGAASALTFRLVRGWLDTLPAFLVSLPLALLGVYCIYPHPFYDPDACVAILIALAVIAARGDSLLAGALTVAPLLVKQNIGVAFLAAAIVYFVVERRWRSLAGAGAALAAAVVVIGAIFGAGNYIHWTIRFAAERRLPPLVEQLAIYNEPEVWLSTGAMLIAAFVTRARWLIAAPWLWIALRFFVSDDPTEAEINLLRLWPIVLAAAIAIALIRRRWLPLVIVAAVHGAMLSQSTWGSTYGIWPLLVIFLAFVAHESRAPLAAVAVIAAVTLLSAWPYVRDNSRLKYAKWNEGAPHASALPALRGMRMRGAWLPQFEQLVAYTDAHIPRGDAILSLPGEDLFYFTTGRRPRVPVLMFDRTVNPLSPPEIAALGVDWIIVKRRLQLSGEPFPELAETLRRLQPRFRLEARLENYDLWRRADLVRGLTSGQGTRAGSSPPPRRIRWIAAVMRYPVTER